MIYLSLIITRGYSEECVYPKIFRNYRLIISNYGDMSVLRIYGADNLREINEMARSG